MNEKDIIEQLISAFPTPYSVECNVRYSNGQIFDAIIYYKTVPYVLVEIKESEQKFQSAIKHLLKGEEIVKSYWRLVTNGSTCCLKGGREINFTSYSLDEALRKIKDIQSLTEGVDITSLARIKDVFAKYKYNKFGNDLELVPAATNQPHIVFKSKEDEENFFISFLGELDKSKEIHRYTTLLSAFETINNWTYRMNGIRGMNDNTEGIYWEKLIPDDEIYSVNSLNNMFISSFSEKKDDLTMWRLYGDDGQGICMSFELKDEDSYGFDIAKVCYVNTQSDVYKMVSELVKNGFRFWGPERWNCFFKPKEYDTENEIRLLHMRKSKEVACIEKHDFCVAKDSSVIIPFIILKMEEKDFPLKLKKITLGPKCKAKNTNIEQLRYLLNVKGAKVEVLTSKIETYQ